jgi:hypothetical protein
MATSGTLASVIATAPPTNLFVGGNAARFPGCRAFALLSDWVGGAEQGPPCGANALGGTEDGCRRR